MRAAVDDTAKARLGTSQSAALRFDGTSISATPSKNKLAAVTSAGRPATVRLRSGSLSATMNSSIPNLQWRRYSRSEAPPISIVPIAATRITVVDVRPRDGRDQAVSDTPENRNASAVLAFIETRPGQIDFIACESKAQPKRTTAPTTLETTPASF